MEQLLAKAQTEQTVWDTADNGTTAARPAREMAFNPMSTGDAPSGGGNPPDGGPGQQQAASTPAPTPHQLRRMKHPHRKVLRVKQGGCVCFAHHIVFARKISIVWVYNECN